MSERRHPLRRLLSHLKHHQFTVLLASLCSILNKFWDLAPPILIGMAIDVVVQREESSDILPDLRDDNLLLFSIFEYFIISRFILLIKNFLILV